MSDQLVKIDTRFTPSDQCTCSIRSPWDFSVKEGHDLYSVKYGIRS